MGLVQELQETQRLRHVVANKVTLPLTILRSLQEGQPLSPHLLDKAIHDLQALVQAVEEQHT